MSAIVFICTQRSGSSREALKAARNLGYEVILLTNSLIQVRSEEFPEVKEMVLCNIEDIDDIRNEIKKLQKYGYEIVSIISFIDSYGYTASILAEEFGVGCFTAEAILKMQDKTSSRECLKNTPYAPWFKIINNKTDFQIRDAKYHLPLVVKDPHSTGSKDVYLVNTTDELYNKIDRLLNNSYHEVIVEEYLEGPQYLVETLVENKKVHIVAIIEQEIYLYKGHSIIIGYGLKHNLPQEFEKSLRNAVNDIINLHGMENGSCHLELRYVNNSWKLVEINPRISGGGMNEFIRYGLGINLVEETLKLALKEPLNLEPKFNMYTNAQYLICFLTGKLIKVTGRNDAIKSDGVISVFIKPRRGQMIYPPVSMGYRYAYVIANGQSEEDAKLNAKIAINKIKLHVLKE